MRNRRAGEEDLLVIGCSSSEVAGKRIGTFSHPEIASAVWEGVYPFLRTRKIDVAAQCCEHLNRVLIIEERVARLHGWEIVNVVPQPKAGGSFATAAYQALERPVAVEHIRAKAKPGYRRYPDRYASGRGGGAAPAGRDPYRGEAIVLSARTRPKCIGGVRAGYDERLL